MTEAQTVVGQKQFSGNVTLSSGFFSINGYLNGHNMSNEFLDKTSDQIISGNKTFKDGFSADANSTVSGLVDGVDISDFAQRLVYESADAVITGSKIIKSEVSTIGSLEVDGEVNDIKFSSDLMTINRDQNVTGIKEFDSIEVENDVYAENVTIIDEVNGTPWEEFLENRVTLSSNQHISGYFVFNKSSHVNNDITLSGLVNGFNVSRLEENTLSKTKDQTITGEKNISGLVDITTNATFLGLVDGVNITEWMEEAMRLTGNQEVTEEKVFVDPLEIEGNLDVAGFVNGLNISFMVEDAVMKNSSGPQNIHGDKIFENGLDLKSNLTVRNLVNGINVSNAVTLSGNQDISGFYSFTEGLLAEGDVTVDGVINGVNVSHINVAVLKLDNEENVNAHMTFTDEILVDQDVLVTELSDGVDVSELDAQALNLQDPFNFTGEITINAPITFLDDVDFVGDSNNRDLSEWAATVVTTNTNQDINGTKVFAGLLKSDNPIQVTENLALETAFGVNLTEWTEDIVYRDENKTISGKKIFKDEVDVEGDIIVDGTVDGIDISEEIVTLLGEQTVTGKKKFSALVKAFEDVEVSGLVNGLYLPDLLEDTFNLGAPMNITGDKTFLQDVDILGDLQLALFNSSIFRIPIRLSDDFNMTGHYTFEGETEFTNDLIITGLASLQNLTEIARSRVTLSGSDQAVEGTWTVTGNVTFEVDVATNHLISGFNLLEMEQDWDIFLRKITSDIKRLQWISSEICNTIDDLQDTYEGAFADLDFFESVQTIPKQSQSMAAFSYGGTMYLAIAVYAEDHVYLCVDSYIYRWSDSNQQFLLSVILLVTEKIKFDFTDSVTTNGAMKWTSLEIGSTKFLAVANAGVFPCIGDEDVHSDIFIFNGSLVLYQTVAIISLDVESFTIGNKTYLVFAGDDSLLEIFLHNADLNQFELIQTVVAESAVGAIEFVNIQNQRFLVIVESSSEVALVYEIEEVGISFFHLVQHSCIVPHRYPFNSWRVKRAVEIKHDAQGHKNGNFTIHHTISSKYAYDVTTCRIDGKIGVVFAGFSTVEEDLWGLTSQTDSLIYFWSEAAGIFEIAEYVIPFRRASDVAFMTVGHHSYILLVEQYTRVELFRYEGSGHFVSAFNIPIPGIKSVEAFSLNNEIYLAIAVDPLIHDRPSRIIKANLQGNVYTPVKDLCDVSFGEMISHSEDDICFL
ncbi:Thrombospondin-type laminin G domain and EAR repeat-containing protein [Holothuria leucospilota]|uniref:Thrombospondin-type laminin G domain and EAR repeat-containing protein n=1 Tax=Holothuria leucospilota TaxID=206669 RepID=A0A9Q1CGV3_HOLLE|nr:Thrombospondin-type laminin G domain and EAR repeat-containing protein [Holothuria leucospilota]